MTHVTLALALATGPAGVYTLTGEREVASQLTLKPDGTFEYMLVYGAADFQSQGKWRVDEDSVVLDAKTSDTPPVRLTSSRFIKVPAIRVWVKAANGQGVPNIDVFLGDESARTDAQGAAMFQPTETREVRFEVPVYMYQGKPRALNSKHNDFTFEINGEAITQVPFNGERLLLKDGKLELRYWKKDRPIVYTKE